MFSMAKKSGLRIGLYILAIALLGAAATQATFAKGAAFRAHHAKRFSQSAGQHASRSMSGHPNPQGVPTTNYHTPAEISASPEARDVKAHDSASTPNNAGLDERGGKQKNMTGSVAGPKGGGVKIPSNDDATANDRSSVETRARDLNAIDTRITVQSRRTNTNPNKLRDLKSMTTSVAPRGAAVRRGNAPEAGNHVARNAVGARVVRHEDGRGRDGKTHGAVAVSAAAAAGIDRSIPDSLAKADGSLGGRPSGVQPSVVQPNAISTVAPTVAPAALNRGMINGTKVVRLGFAPAVIGGPTKTVAGISGTMIRPKH